MTTVSVPLREDADLVTEERARAIVAVSRRGTRVTE